MPPKHKVREKSPEEKHHNETRICIFEDIVVMSYFDCKGSAVFSQFLCRGLFVLCVLFAKPVLEGLRMSSFVHARLGET